MNPRRTQRKSENMHNQFVAPEMTEFVPDGLFSHPDSDDPSTKPGPAPEQNQRAYTGLFQEPADGPENDRSAA